MVAECELDRMTRIARERAAQEAGQPVAQVAAPTPGAFVAA